MNNLEKNQVNLIPDKEEMETAKRNVVTFFNLIKQKDEEISRLKKLEVRISDENARLKQEAANAKKESDKNREFAKHFDILKTALNTAVVKDNAAFSGKTDSLSSMSTEDLFNMAASMINDYVDTKKSFEEETQACVRKIKDLNKKYKDIRQKLEDLHAHRSAAEESLSNANYELRNLKETRIKQIEIIQDLKKKVESKEAEVEKLTDLKKTLIKKVRKSFSSSTALNFVALE